MAISLNKQTTNTHHQFHTQWHGIDFREAAFFLDTDLEMGLTTPEVKRRQEQFERNELTPKRGERLWLRLLRQSYTPTLLVLLVIGAIKAVLGAWANAMVIWGFALLNAIICYLQASNTKGVLATLAKAVSIKTTVVRGGQKTRVLANELVPGDLVLLTAGDRVPADLRLVYTHNLQVNESALTQKSLSVNKITSALTGNKPLAERYNMAYAGSFVTFGQGSGIVVATGNAMEIGRVAQSIPQQSSQLVTPLTHKLTKLYQTALYIVLTLASLAFVLGLGQGHDWTEIYEGIATLVISAIPLSLPIFVTATLVIGIARMLDRHAIIRKPSSLETLGNATVICSNKTGTLTENQITVQRIFAGQKRYKVSGVGYSLEGTIRTLGDSQPIHFGGRILDTGYTVSTTDKSHSACKIALQECLIAGLLCNDSHLEPKYNQWRVFGNPTDGALIVAARKAGLSQSKLSEAMPRLDTIPFTSEYQYMATLHGLRQQVKHQHSLSYIPDSTAKTIYVKGAVTTVLDRCCYMMDDDGNLLALNRASVEAEVETMAKQGLRVLVCAKKLVDNHHKSLTHKDVASELIFLGLQGMIAPLRPEVFSAIQTCYNSGIQVKIITGDHLTTSVAIASQLGLHDDDRLVAFEGSHLTQMSDADFAQAVAEGVVFAGVNPSQKLRLVEALQSQGEIVVSTGERVKDTSVLRQADIGVAMADAGTDIARDTADLLLLDDNFASVTAAVEEGRKISQNLRQGIAFLVPINVGVVIPILLSTLMIQELPISSVQILWLNLISSTVLALPLAFENKSPQITPQPLNRLRQPLLLQRFLWRLIIVSTFNWILIVGMFVGVRYAMGDLAVARTMVIQALTMASIVHLLSLSQVGQAIALKSQGEDTKVHSSPALVPSVLCTIVLQIIFSQWGVMNVLFQTTPLSWSQWLICFIPAVLMVGVVAVVHHILRKYIFMYKPQRNVI